MKIPKWLNLLIIFISPICSFIGVTLFTIPRGVLLVITVVGFIIIITCFCIIKYIDKEKKRNIKKLNNLSKRISRLSDNDTEIKKNKKERYKYIKKCNKNIDNNIKKLKSYIITTIIILAIFYIPRCKPLVTFAKEFINVAMSPFYEVPEPTVVPTPEPTVVPTPEPTVVPTPEPNNNDNIQKEWIRFVLEYPNSYPNIDNKKYNENLVLLFYSDEDNLDDIMKSDIQIWLNGCTPNTSLEMAVTSSGKSTDYYTNIETSFSNENGKTQSSRLLDELITGRKELFDLYPNGTLAWHLANHMQTYALNYLEQTNDERSILYFYMESIQYTQKSLEFEMDNETRYMRINYLMSKYKDIGECEKINKDTRIQAYNIYISIQDALNELGIPLQNTMQIY